MAIIAQYFILYFKTYFKTYWLKIYIFFFFTQITSFQLD